MDQKNDSTQAKSKNWMAISAAALAIVYTLFILNSYPMMYPGYDIWWHLGVIQTGAAYDPSMAEYARWHRAWDSVLAALHIENIFTRALVIHRTQFLITAACIAYAGYTCLTSVFRDPKHKNLCWLSSLIAIAIWLSMHGTHSSANFGGEASALTQSWIGWYSVNYQISLPFYLVAAAGTLAIASSAHKDAQALQTGAIVIGALAVLIYCHLAELPYYLCILLISAAIFGSIKQKAIFATTFAILIMALTAVLPYVSHRIPELPSLIMSGSFSEVIDLIRARGASLTELGGNRGETSWNPIYTWSTIGIVASAIAAKWLLKREQFHIKSAIFIATTGLLPLALYNKYTSGVLTIITNQELAWRFCFASLLFLGLPILFITTALAFKHQQKTIKILAVAVTSGILTTTIYTSSTSAAVRGNMRSILWMQSPKAMYFGISDENRLALESFNRKIESETGSDKKCLDIFSTYYLFYLYNEKKMCLPPSISSIPGAIKPTTTDSPCNCNFEKDTKEFSRLGMSTPKWKFNFFD